MNETETHLTVADPLKLEIINHHGVPSMMTTYWIPLPDEELRVDIRQNHVIMVSDIPEDMEEFYMKALKHAKNQSEDREDIINRKKTYSALAGLTSNTVFH